jgi:hypothetical protein
VRKYERDPVERERGEIKKKKEKKKKKEIDV